MLKAALSLLFSLRSGLSSLVDRQPEVPQLASPLGGDLGKGIVTALVELALFFSVWLGALCHFFHERYQRNFYIWASPSSMKNPASCPHTGSSVGAVASRGAPLSGRDVYRETTRVLLLLWLCPSHSLRAKCCFYLVFFFFASLEMFVKNIFKIWSYNVCDFPDGPGKSELPMQGPWVQSQVTELRSCMLHRVAGKKNTNMI